MWTVLAFSKDLQSLTEPTLACPLSLLRVVIETNTNEVAFSRRLRRKKINYQRTSISSFEKGDSYCLEMELSVLIGSNQTENLRQVWDLPQGHLKEARPFAARILPLAVLPITALNSLWK